MSWLLKRLPVLRKSKRIFHERVKLAQTTNSVRHTAFARRKHIQEAGDDPVKKKSHTGDKTVYDSNEPAVVQPTTQTESVLTTTGTSSASFYSRGAHENPLTLFLPQVDKSLIDQMYQDIRDAPLPIIDMSSEDEGEGEGEGQSQYQGEGQGQDQYQGEGEGEGEGEVESEGATQNSGTVIAVSQNKDKTSLLSFDMNGNGHRAHTFSMAALPTLTRFTASIKTFVEKKHRLSAEEDDLLVHIGGRCFSLARAQRRGLTRVFLCCRNRTRSIRNETNISR